MDNFDLKKFLVENKLTTNSRLFNEAAIETGPEDNLKSVKFPKGKEYRVGEDDPNDDGIIIQIKKHSNGYFITGATYSDPHDYYDDPEGETAKEAYGYALDLAGNEMDEDDLVENKLTRNSRSLNEGATNLRGDWPDLEFEYEGKTYKVEFDLEEEGDDFGNSKEWIAVGEDQFGDEWEIVVSTDRWNEVNDYEPDTIQRAPR